MPALRSAIIFLAVIGVALVASGGMLSVRILDENGSPTSARVYLTDAAGQARFAPHVITYDKGRDEQHFVPPGGHFEVELAAGTYSLRVERGKEYLPVEEKIQVSREGKTTRSIRLERWARMNDRDWYSGDMHMHRPLREVATLLESEDLNVTLPTTRWRLGGTKIDEDPELAAFLSKADDDGVVMLPNHRWFTVLNEELESGSSSLLGSHLAKRPSNLDFPFVEYGRQLRQRGAFADSEKASSLEFPAEAALGGCDLVGLANNHFWRSGYYGGPWGAWPGQMLRPYPVTCAGFALAGFETYYALLNMGFPLKISAGTASGVHPVPPGWSRVYVHVRDAFTPQNWFAALKAGRSFVTTGPMLLLKVNGHEPGEEVRGQAFPLRAAIEVEVLSLAPVSSAEVVINGEISKLPLLPGAEEHAYSGRLVRDLATSSWVAARWVEDRGKHCSLAHAAPVYFWKGQEPVPAREVDRAYLARHVQQLIEEVETGKTADGRPTSIVSYTDRLRRDTLEDLERALKVYTTLSH